MTQKFIVIQQVGLDLTLCWQEFLFENIFPWFPCNNNCKPWLTRCQKNWFFHCATITHGWVRYTRVFFIKRPLNASPNWHLWYFQLAALTWNNGLTFNFFIIEKYLLHHLIKNTQERWDFLSSWCFSSSIWSIGPLRTLRNPDAKCPWMSHYLRCRRHTKRVELRTL